MIVFDGRKHIRQNNTENKILFLWETDLKDNILVYSESNTKFTLERRQETDYTMQKQNSTPLSTPDAF